MEKLKDLTKKRAKKILYSDKLISPQMFRQTLKLEVFSVLKEFMDLQLSDVGLSVMVEPTGKFKINIVAQTDKIKPVGQIIR